MALSKIDQLRKRQLIAQNDLLRETLSDCSEDLQTGVVWIEQGSLLVRTVFENWNSSPVMKLWKVFRSG